MVRISNTLLPTNSSGVPQYEMTNTSVAITAAGTLNVSDSTAQSSLSSINSAVSGTLNVSDSTAQGSLGTIATNTSSANTTLSSIDSSLSGTLNVVDSSANSTLSSIDSSLSGTLQVSSSATINGSAGNLYNASSVSNGTDSSVVSIASYTKNTIYLTSTTGDEVRVYVRGASGAGFHYHSSLYPMDPAAGTNNEAVLSLKDEVVDAIKLTATNTATITASVFSRA